MKSFLRCSLVLIILLGGLISTASAQDDQPVLGAINIIDADLFVTPADSSAEVRLIERSVFEPGETLRVDENGTALVTWFYDGTEMVLDGNSTLKLNDFSGDADHDFVIDTELSAGHLVAGLGDVSYLQENGSFTIATPAFVVKVLRGQIDLTVAEDGATRLIVTQGRAEVMVEGSDVVVVDEQYSLASDATEPQSFTDDGVTVSLDGVCTASTNTDLVVRLAPNQDSRMLAGVPTGQVLWVRAGSEGNLWLQVNLKTAADDEEGQNFGWVYGPAVTLSANSCTHIMHAPLDAEIFGGEGIDEAGDSESDPLSS